MFEQELKIVEKKVILINKKSSLDDERNISDEDVLFTLGDDNCLHLGSKDTELNMVVLKPKTDKRSTEDDVTLERMIQHRVDDHVLHPQVGEYFTGKLAVNKTRARLKVSIYSLDTQEKLGENLSESIIDTNNKECGALVIYDVSALKSCSLGGRKIMMVSEFGLAKDVVPMYQLWQEEERVEEKLEEELIRQPEPENIKIVRDTIIFISPPQPNILQINHMNMKIKLLARRMKDGVESNSFDFHYEPHNAATYLKTINNNISFNFRCIFCDQCPDALQPERTDLAKTLQVARPGTKRKMLPAQRSKPKQGRVSTDSDSTSELLSPCSYQSQTSSPPGQSPDSGIQTSPSHLGLGHNSPSELDSGLGVSPSLSQYSRDFYSVSNIDEVGPWTVGNTEEHSGLDHASLGFTREYVEDLAPTICNLTNLDPDNEDEIRASVFQEYGLEDMMENDFIEKDGSNKIKSNNHEKIKATTNISNAGTSFETNIINSLYRLCNVLKYSPVIFILVLFFYSSIPYLEKDGSLFEKFSTAVVIAISSSLLLAMVSG